MRRKSETDSKARLFEERKMSDGSTARIIRYEKANDISVEFLDEYGHIVEKAEYKDFCKGSIKNPYNRRVFGVGYIGVGRHKSRDFDGFKSRKTKMYQTWAGMFRRCYENGHLETHPSYRGVTVCEEWHNFQNFGDWYEENYYEVDGERMDLDKDILVAKNKIYSPDKCVFVPQNINILLIKQNKLRGSYPIGVNKHGNRFQARCSDLDNKINIGTFDTPEEAFIAYKSKKEYIIKKRADEYKSKIPDKVYRALYNYEVNISD